MKKIHEPPQVLTAHYFIAGLNPHTVSLTLGANLI